METKDYTAEILAIIRSNTSPGIMRYKLEDYHANDLAEVFPLLSTLEKRKLCRVLPMDMLSDIFEYLDQEAAAQYLDEIDIKKAATILSEMETDSVIEILRIMPKDKKNLLIDLMDDEARRDVAMIAAFNEDEIGSKMTTNCIMIKESLSIKEAMNSLVEQAEKNDNITTLFIVDDDNTYYGAMDLKDLIIARKGMSLEDLAVTSYPYVYGNEPIDDCIERLKDYSEDSIPVLDNDNKLLGIITSQDMVEMVDEAFGEDYAKFAGLTSEEDLNEPLKESIKKRLPWLLLLLGLGMIVSSVVGLFETVVSQLTIVMAFQSLILGMSGNVGTQALSVTIRVLTDGDLTGKKRAHLVFKEMRVAFTNGLILGVVSFILIGLYIALFKGYSFSNAYAISACFGVALILSMVISGAVGTLIPIFFKRINVDPAAASGPLITTINDLVAVVSYYGLCWIFLINFLHMVG